MLADAVELAGRVAPSRVLFGPHETNLARRREISDRHLAYYARRVAGGAGVIVTEIASVHGSSEAWDTPGRIYHPVRGNFVRDALARGYRLGFIGSGDSHDGHPGLVQLAGPHGGLAALIGAEPTRESILATLRARRVYATNGPRIFLRVELDGAPMGSILEAAAIPTDPSTQALEVRTAGTAVIDHIDVVRGRAGAPAAVEPSPGDGEREWSGRRDIPRLAAGDYVYVRIVQVDGGAAWSSPIYAK